MKNSPAAIDRPLRCQFFSPKKTKGEETSSKAGPPFRLEIEYHNSATTKGKDSCSSRAAKQHMAICRSRQQQANPYKSNASVVIESIGQHQRVPQMAPSLAILVVGAAFIFF
jgi:hypothetical protein